MREKALGRLSGKPRQIMTRTKSVQNDDEIINARRAADNGERNGEIIDVDNTEDTQRAFKPRFEMLDDLNDVIMDSINNQKDSDSKK